MDEITQKVKKHKKKHKHDIERVEKAVLSETEKAIVETSDLLSQGKEKKSKKKKKKRSKGSDSENEKKAGNEPDIDENNSYKRKLSEVDTEYDQEKSEKKRKKKDFGEEDRDNEIINTEEEIDLNSKKKKKSKKKIELDIDLAESLNEKANSDKTNTDLSEDVDGQEKKSKHKKKKKQKCEPEEIEEAVESKEEKDEIECQGSKKKKKKDKKDKDIEKEGSKIDRSNKICDRNFNGYAESKKERKETEVNKTQNKDMERCETNGCAKEAENKDLTSGQWSSVELGDSERQNKFFRLLGGFKKGNDTSQIQNKFSLGKKSTFGSTNNKLTKTGGNYAMNKKQEDIYTKALEGEYDRAMSMNLNRGIGLGFEKPPEEGKKFYIDTKSSKSIKFDN